MTTEGTAFLSSGRDILGTAQASIHGGFSYEFHSREKVIVRLCLLKSRHFPAWFVNFQ
jgi:hypothetical protein